MIGRDNPYRLSEARDEHGFQIQAIIGGHLGAVGWMEHKHPEVLEALYLAEGFLRSPTALAGLLEAASHEALLQAGRMVLEQLERKGGS